MINTGSKRCQGLKCVLNVWRVNYLAHVTNMILVSIEPSITFAFGKYLILFHLVQSLKSTMTDRSFEQAHHIAAIFTLFDGGKNRVQFGKVAI